MRKQYAGLVVAVIVSLYSPEGWGRECCYSKTGELIPCIVGGGTVIRMSAHSQPLTYLRQEHWHKKLCTELAGDREGYSKIRPLDDCSGYFEPHKHGTCLIGSFTLCANSMHCWNTTFLSDKLVKFLETKPNHDVIVI